ncbi:hypothetical protein [Tropicimonas sp. IMCC34043]|uniref:hypothetical protein n=1 Tax=Tropicimonas sp. IMCC34043 TaxID=2248760 RepID=UPI000E244CAE|nr:hypothetical protein [Tropicimonas sp. IMCC34043]
MIETKQINLRARPTHHALLRRINDRLKADPGFEGVLRQMLDDQSACNFMPEREARAELHQINRRIEALERAVGL